MNKLNEKWERYEPTKGLSRKYYIDSIKDSINCFQIILSDDYDGNNKVEVLFKDSVHAYRSTEESFNLKMMNSIDESYGTDFYSNWTFFKVENSEYIQWISEQSYGISDSQQLLHFCFIASDSILDVIAAYEPRVQKIRENR